MELTPEIVNAALEEFTAKTDIPMVIIVDSAERVFGVEENTTDLKIRAKSCFLLEAKTNTVLYKNNEKEK